jgi:hypothetical protein
MVERYLIAIHHPDDYDGSSEGEDMRSEIDSLNDEMVAAGVRIFVGGLQAAEKAKSIIADADGKLSVSDGPYLKGNEYVGGLWVLEVANLDEALEWGRKAAKACHVPVEVRPFN